EGVERVLGVEIQIVGSNGAVVVCRLDCLRLGRCVERDGGGRGGGAGRVDFEFDLQLTPARQCEHVLEKSHVIVFKPHFATIVGYFQNDAVAVELTGAQWSEPEVERVGAQHRAKMFLGGTPNLFSRSLHALSPKKPVLRAFYSPSLKIGFRRGIPAMLAK